jgi:hypothetical protein
MTIIDQSPNSFKEYEAKRKGGYILQQGREAFPADWLHQQ